MDEEDAVYAHSEILFIKEERNPVTCRNVDGTRDCGIWEKPEAERKVSFLFFQTVEFRGKEMYKNKWGLTRDVKGEHVEQEKEIYKGY